MVLAENPHNKREPLKMRLPIVPIKSGLVPLRYKVGFIGRRGVIGLSIPNGTNDVSGVIPNSDNRSALLHLRGISGNLPKLYNPPPSHVGDVLPDTLIPTNSPGQPFFRFVRCILQRFKTGDLTKPRSVREHFFRSFRSFSRYARIV